MSDLTSRIEGLLTAYRQLDPLTPVKAGNVAYDLQAALREGPEIGQCEDSGTVNALTAIVREADRTFERVGGSSRHWVRDCFLPLLNQRGYALSKGPGGGEKVPGVRPVSTVELLRERARWYRAGCPGLDDQGDYKISGDMCIDVADDLEAALALALPAPPAEAEPKEEK